MTNSKPNARGIPFVEGYLNKGGGQHQLSDHSSPGATPAVEAGCRPPSASDNENPPPKKVRRPGVDRFL